MARKVKVLDDIESMHQWLDEKDQLQSVTPKFEAGTVLDADEIAAEGVQNVDKWFDRLIAIGHASDDLAAPVKVHIFEPAERVVPRAEAPTE